jgi:two-component system response regulator LytT
MKVLVVDEEHGNVVKLEKALKNIDNSIRIIGAVPALLNSAEWMQQHGEPDILLVNKQVVRQRQLTSSQANGLKATVTFKVHTDEYTFLAFRIASLEHLFPQAVVKNNMNGNGVPEKKCWCSNPQPSYRSRFLVKQGQRFASIETNAIAYFFSEGRFIFFKTFDNQKYLVEYTLEELEEMLNPQDFFRINRSLVVSFRSVNQIHPYFGNRLKLYLDPPMEKEIIVSREKVHGFKNWLGQ